MESPFTDLDFERFIYRQGQLLASRDFRDQGRMEAARRWMHNTATHNAWGVAVGYEFSLPEGGETGGGAEEEDLDNVWGDGQRLIVQAGIAYDCFGRELILAEAVSFSKDDDVKEHLPDSPGAQRLFLVASYPELNAQRSRAHGCSSPASVLFPPPRLQWKAERDVRYGLEVPILFVIFANDGHQVQRYSPGQLHPQARPKLASGQTVPGQTAWRVWQTGERLLGLEVDIDTSDAGFQQTPCYFARQSGPLSRVIKNMDSSLKLLSLPWFVSLANETPDGFTFRVMPISILQMETIGPRFGEQPLFNVAVAAIEQTLASINPAEANRHKLTVCWLGIESRQPDIRSVDVPPPVDEPPIPM